MYLHYHFFIALLSFCECVSEGIQMVEGSLGCQSSHLKTEPLSYHCCICRTSNPLPELPGILLSPQSISLQDFWGYRCIDVLCLDLHGFWDLNLVSRTCETSSLTTEPILLSLFKIYSRVNELAHSLASCCACMHAYVCVHVCVCLSLCESVWV